MKTLFLAVIFSIVSFAQTTYNGHVIFTGSAPTVSNCGASPTIVSTGTDNGGTVTVGASTRNNLGQVVPVLQCTLTFATSFTFAPAVVLSTNRPSIEISIGSKGTTTVIVYFSSDAAGSVFTYVAF